jgi:cytochrome c peroxidase
MFFLSFVSTTKTMRALTVLFLLLTLSACQKPAATSSPSALSAADIGKLIFHDVSLSASGKQSCASCHSPEHAHAQANALSVQFGGPLLDQPGTRAVPSIRYLSDTPPLGFDEEGTPYGGFNHDGSVDTLAAQAERPLLAANEMANLTREAVVEKLRKAGYAAQFRQVVGETSLDQVDTAFAALSLALERYQSDSPEFQPFSSKYDAYLAGKTQLTDAESRGLKLFNDEKKGNCAACHPSAKREDGRSPLFSDFTYDALGMPRNMEIPANADPNYVDLGLCRSGRTGRASQDTACGKFKVPTLRNVATRQVFFHNGQIKTLRDAVAFYVSRDTQPEHWYPRKADKSVSKFNDLPAKYHANVNVEEVPYGGKRGGKPALSDQEIEDIVSFLRTLTDQ